MVDDHALQPMAVLGYTLCSCRSQTSNTLVSDAGRSDVYRTSDLVAHELIDNPFKSKSRTVEVFYTIVHDSNCYH